MPWWRSHPDDGVKKPTLPACCSWPTAVTTGALALRYLQQDDVFIGRSPPADSTTPIFAWPHPAEYRRPHARAESRAGLLWLSKENFSNGSINTVDVHLSSAPLYFLYNPKLLEGMLERDLLLQRKPPLKKPFAAHDLGTYPIANGQTYGETCPSRNAGI